MAKDLVLHWFIKDMTSYVVMFRFTVVNESLTGGESENEQWGVMD